MRHIPEDELHAYLDQGLSRSQCVEIESHLAVCSSCRATRDGIAALRDRTTALLATLAPPRRFPPAFETRSAAWPSSGCIPVAAGFAPRRGPRVSSPRSGSAGPRARWSARAGPPASRRANAAPGPAGEPCPDSFDRRRRRPRRPAPAPETLVRRAGGFEAGARARSGRPRLGGRGAGGLDPRRQAGRPRPRPGAWSWSRWTTVSPRRASSSRASGGRCRGMARRARPGRACRTSTACRCSGCRCRRTTKASGR